MTPDLLLPRSPFAQVVEQFRAGKMVVMVDDTDRENEGDLVVATQCLTPEHVAFMGREARGLTCVSISVECARRLELPLQVIENNSPFNTPFAVSVDHVSVLGNSVRGNGVTASGRCKTMRALVDGSSRALDFVRPGHVFPLIANPAGVVGRQGQTEGSYDLARIAGFIPSGVICEILNADGSMARGQQLVQFAETHGLLITSVADVLNYRVHHEVLVREVDRSEQLTRYGRCLRVNFADDVEQRQHMALIFGDPKDSSAQVYIHSECVVGDVFESSVCACSQKLEQALQEVSVVGAGVVLYLRRQARGSTTHPEPNKRVARKILECLSVPSEKAIPSYEIPL